MREGESKGTVSKNRRNKDQSDCRPFKEQFGAFYLTV